MPSPPGPLRIGEFARSVGVRPERLRAWERRYGLLRPARSPGGFRLYTDEDAERVAQMLRALADGLSAAEAAQVALRIEPAPPAPAGYPGERLLAEAPARLLDAVKRYDEPAVHAVLDETLAAFGLEAVTREVILPALTQVGLDWSKDVMGISQEHFASNLIRGRLLSLTRLGGGGGGPLALLACPPGEAHDLSLLAFGLLLRSYGWRILFLGADTPFSTLEQTARATEADITVLTVFDPGLLEAEKTALRKLGRGIPILLSGPGATEEVCRRLDLPRLNGDLIGAARELARGQPAR